VRGEIDRLGTRNGRCEPELVPPLCRPVERPFTVQEQDHVTILFVGLMWKRERCMQAVFQASG
jgi:hypothetical protein